MWATQPIPTPPKENPMKIRTVLLLCIVVALLIGATTPT
jgi:hypothetical protein